MTDIGKHVDTLRALIRQHDDAYYVQNAPTISDFEYDKLYRELKDLLQAHPEFKSPDCPTERIGSDRVKSFKKVAHAFPMLSIDNTYNTEEVRDFHERVVRLLGRAEVEYVVEPKIDGVAISLLYEKGRLQLGKTRGDGITGDDVTQNLRTIRAIPLIVETKESFEVRGEAYMTWTTLHKLNEGLREAGDKEMKNPRNAAAGALKLQDPKRTAEKELRFFAYYAQGPSFKITHFLNLERLKNLSFPVNPHIRLCPSIDAVLAALSDMDKLRDTLPYDIDGAVIKVNPLNDQVQLGNTAKSPRWVTAFKYPPQQKPTRLLRIVHQVGRTGVLTPVAEVEPVQLSGTTVSRATLHNYDEIARLDIREGDTVFIEKSGEIIPKIIRVDKTGRSKSIPAAMIPTNCPECQTLLVRMEEEVALRCPNAACPVQQRRRVEHFVARKAMNIDKLGPAIVDKLFSNGLIQDAADLYALKREQLVNLEGLGEKSADYLLQSIEQSKNPPLHRFLFALGVPHVGETVAKILASQSGSLQALREISEERLQTMTEIGPILAKSVISFLNERTHQVLIDKLTAAGIKPLAEKQTLQTGFFTGKSVVITGTLPTLSREEAAARIEAMGGKVVASVSKKIDYLLCGENAGSKLDKAKALGIPVVGEESLANPDGGNPAYR